jgi:hypothetical protein
LRASAPRATSRVAAIESATTLRDRGAARAAVGLEHVAVDPQRALAERIEIDHRAQAATDQPLDLERAARRAARAPASRSPRVSSSRKHRVLRGEPTAPAAGEEARHLASSLTVHSTNVRPTRGHSTEASGCSVKSTSNRTARSASAARPSPLTLDPPTSVG